MTREEARSLIIKQIKDKKMNFFIRPNGDRPSEIIRAYFLRDIAALEMGADALKDRLQGEWIPVNEEFPKLCEEVIVTDVETSETYLSRYIGNEYWECDNGLFKNRIIAWQPKPQPYKAESEGEDKK